MLTIHGKVLKSWDKIQSSVLNDKRICFIFESLFIFEATVRSMKMTNKTDEFNWNKNQILHVLFLYIFPYNLSTAYKSDTACQYEISY